MDKKHFKLCFVKESVLGKSYVKYEKPLRFETPITLKPYAKDEFKVGDLTERIEGLLVLGPKQLHDQPITENQRYGWYDLKIDNRNPSLSYGKHTQQMIKDNLMNFARIRD